jgi:cytidylate kinase
VKAFLIAIDGPSAVGKTTVGRIVAKNLGYHFIDTGLMYRSLTWLALHLKIDLDNKEELSWLAANSRLTMDLSPEKNHFGTRINSYEVSQAIQDDEVEANVSQVSQVAGVRQALVSQQREMASGGKVVMAGRDIGTVVLPWAEIKIFLTASPEERARRRFLAQSGKDYPATLAELKKRDEIDSHRSLSPLTPAEDARLIDTEGLSPEEVAQQIISLAQISL